MGATGWHSICTPAGFHAIVRRQEPRRPCGCEPRDAPIQALTARVRRNDGNQESGETQGQKKTCIYTKGAETRAQEASPLTPCSELARRLSISFGSAATKLTEVERKVVSRWTGDIYPPFISHHPLLLRQWRAGFVLEVAQALVGCEIAGDAAARQLQQVVNVHCVNLNNSIVTAARQPLAVWAPSHAAHNAVVSSQGQQLLPVGRVPNLRRLVPPPRRQPLAAR